MHTVPDDRAAILEAIYSLPVVFRLRGTASLMRLVRETGYPGRRSELGVEDIRSGIAERAGIIAVWQEYSAEKDADWGWYFQGPYQGLYLTGSRTRSLESPINTRDPAEACACFIKAELDSIMGYEVRLVLAAG